MTIMPTFDFKRFDVYRKIPQDLTQPTTTGAIISVICCIFIFFLFISELIAFLSVELVSELFVENSDGSNANDKMVVQLNITLPRLPCSVIGLDIQDDMGRHEVGFVENTLKVPLFDGLGCRFEGRFYVNKVPGNFHVSTHSANTQPDNIDMAHVINELTFGDDVSHLGLEGGFNTLRGRNMTMSNAIESHEYHMKVVPTIYEDSSTNRLMSYQYTSAYKSFIAFTHTGKMIPAIWFRYDMNPITVKYVRRRKPLYSFITTACAMVGGIFTVAGIIDSVIYTSSNLFRKFEIGKLS